MNSSCYPGYLPAQTIVSNAGRSPADQDNSNTFEDDTEFERVFSAALEADLLEGILSSNHSIAGDQSLSGTCSSTEQPLANVNTATDESDLFKDINWDEAGAGNGNATTSFNAFPLSTNNSSTPRASLDQDLFSAGDATDFSPIDSLYTFSVNENFNLDGPILGKPENLFPLSPLGLSDTNHGTNSDMRIVSQPDEISPLEETKSSSAITDFGFDDLFGPNSINIDLSDLRSKPIDNNLPAEREDNHVPNIMDLDPAIQRIVNFVNNRSIRRDNRLRALKAFERKNPNTFVILRAIFGNPYNIPSHSSNVHGMATASPTTAPAQVPKPLPVSNHATASVQALKPLPVSNHGSATIHTQLSSAQIAPSSNGSKYDTALDPVAQRLSVIRQVLTQAATPSLTPALVAVPSFGSAPVSQANTVSRRGHPAKAPTTVSKSNSKSIPKTMLNGTQALSGVTKASSTAPKAKPKAPRRPRKNILPAFDPAAYAVDIGSTDAVRGNSRQNRNKNGVNLSTPIGLSKYLTEENYQPLIVNDYPEYKENHRKPIYPQFSGFFKTSEEARAHRRHTRLPPKSLCPDLERVRLFGRQYWVRRLYEAMIDIRNPIDGLGQNAIHVKRFRDSVTFDPADIEACAHKVFDYALHIHQQGWNRTQVYHRVVTRGSSADQGEHSIEVRLQRLCLMFRLRKSMVNDCLRGGVDMRLTVENPDCRWNTKRNNDRGNAKRSLRLENSKNLDDCMAYLAEREMLEEQRKLAQQAHIGQGISPVAFEKNNTQDGMQVGQEGEHEEHEIDEGMGMDEDGFEDLQDDEMNIDDFFDDLD